MQENLDKYYKLHHPDYLSQGMQVLREYIHFCQFDFMELCKRFDQLKDGTIPEKLFNQALTSEISNTQFYFSPENVSQIIKEVPIAPNKSIDYKELYNLLLKGPPPKNSLNIYRNAILKQKASSMKIKDKNYNEEIARLFSEETANYFDRKARFDFQHLNLHLLDVELLATSSGDIIFDDQLQEKISRFTQLNNTIILENFQIIISKKISINALPQIAHQFIQPEKIEIALLEYLGGRKNQKMFPILMKDQFIQLLKTKLYNQELTLDEYNLLYWIIWKKYDFGEFTLKSLIKWILETRQQRPKDLIKLYDQKNISSEVIQYPKIFKKLLEISQKFGCSVLREAFKPFTQNNMVNLENLKIVLRSLEIGHTQDEFNEFRFYCANRSLFTLNKAQQILMKVDDLIKALSPDTKQEEELESSDTEKAYLTFFKSLMISVLNGYEEKAKRIMEADQMIEEMQLRKIVTENFQIDQNSLTILLHALDHNIEPSAQKPIRSVYFPEFIEKLKSRFIDNLSLPKQPLVEFEKPKIEQQLQQPFNYQEGQFVGETEKAFFITPLDDRVVLEKLRLGLQEYFKVQQGTEYNMAEMAVHKFLLHIQNFDTQKHGHLSKDVLFDLLQDILKFSTQEVHHIVDFAMGVASVDDYSFSYMFFCIQLNEYFQKKQLLTQMKQNY